MSRQARQRSESGIYHIIMRGINKQIIFEDDEDREKFIDIYNIIRILLAILYMDIV
jgi:REP element-mobilizing transposase RayT